MTNTTIVMTLMLALLSFTGVADAAEPQVYQSDIIKAECQKYGLSSTLVYGVIMAESGFDTLADSGSSKGVMQLNKNTYPALVEALGIADFDVFDFEDNVQAGIYHLANLRDYWTEQGYLDEEVFSLMLISYNRGVAGCRKYVERYGIENGYVDQVLKYKSQLERGDNMICKNCYSRMPGCHDHCRAYQTYRNDLVNKKQWLNEQHALGIPRNWIHYGAFCRQVTNKGVKL